MVKLARLKQEVAVILELRLQCVQSPLQILNTARKITFQSMGQNIHLLLYSTPDALLAKVMKDNKNDDKRDAKYCPDEWNQ